MNREDRSSFALRLRTLRKKAKLTQADVAEKLNIHRTAYTKYETDRANPDKACLVTLSEMFGVSVDELLGKETMVAAVLQDATATDVVVQLAPREQELLAAFRRLTTQQQEDLLQVERELTRENQKK